MIDGEYRSSSDANTNYHAKLGCDVRETAWLRGFWVESLPVTTLTMPARLSRFMLANLN